AKRDCHGWMVGRAYSRAAPLEVAAKVTSLHFHLGGKCSSELFSRAFVLSHFGFISDFAHSGFEIVSSHSGLGVSCLWF
ncbi:MAG TPA: hypothetical protein VHC72_09125, partial [Bryobacteraceae bacterium]|nr:hypothetical protein [Bryobacteraceae bacterium]